MIYRRALAAECACAALTAKVQTCGHNENGKLITFRWNSTTCDRPRNLENVWNSGYGALHQNLKQKKKV